MNDKELQEAREKKYLQILDKLNRKKRWGENNIFDCGELGFLHIWWYHQWHHEWIIPSTEFKGAT